MKPTGQHPHNRLSATKVRALKEPGRYADGNGLYLVVDPSGAKRWMLRTVVHGKRRDIGLGGLSLVSLAEARERAIEYRKTARRGGDPLKERRASQRSIPTFEEAARTVHADRSSAWKNKKHRDQWINTLETYAFPALATLRVDQIDTPDILNVLAPIWQRKPETARRIRQRMGVVFDWAKAAGFRAGDNPVEGVTKGLSKQSKHVVHHAALPYSQVPQFVTDLRESDANEITKLAFEFLILTAARTGEVIGAVTDEIDTENALWTIPGERTKTGRSHRVPLSPRCLEILDSANELSDGSEYVFPGSKVGKSLSNVAILMTLRRMDVGVTVHGFRSSFRDWASERTHFSREVCELALAHVIKDKTEAAYRRGDLLEKRRELMETWGTFVTSAQAEVVSLRAKGRQVA
jgi:integrase